jgi:membrane protein required for colicin V production
VGVNIFDVALLLVLALFVGIGVWRGLVRELVSFLTWIGAALAAWAFADDLAGQFKTLTQEDALRQMLAFVIIFLCVFIVGALIGLTLHKFVNRSSGLRFVNRVVGGALGLARGVAVVVIVFLLAGLTAFPQHAWWRAALLTPAFERAASYAAQYLPPDIARHVRYG